MKDAKLKLRMLFECLKGTFKDWRIVCSGQNENADILQLSHRLEKGLLIKNPRPLWGSEKAKKLYNILKTNQSTEATIAKGVVNAYIDQKKHSQHPEEIAFIKENGFSRFDDQQYEGGQLTIKKPVYTDGEVKFISSVFTSRHSIRKFNESTVDDQVIRKAINLAMSCPSACNRQPYHVYIVDRETKEKFISDNSGIKANKTLYVTGDISAYTPDEFNDWLISPSIFIGYLSLALHVYGIGACIIRKDLVVETEYNNKVRSVCKIPKQEKLIIEIAVGNFDDDIEVPLSKRKNVEDVVTVVND